MSGEEQSQQPLEVTFDLATKKAIIEQHKKTRVLIGWLVAGALEVTIAYNLVQMKRLEDCMSIARSAMHEVYCAARYPTLF